MAMRRFSAIAAVAAGILAVGGVHFDPGIPGNLSNPTEVYAP